MCIRDSYNPNIDGLKSLGSNADPDHSPTAHAHKPAMTSINLSQERDTNTESREQTDGVIKAGFENKGFAVDEDVISIAPPGSSN